VTADRQARRRRRLHEAKARGRGGSPPAADRTRALWACLLLAGLTLIVYGRVWTHEFIDMDDYDYIVRNPAVAAGLTWRGVAWAFTTGHAANWHPVTWLSHMLDVELFGLRPGAHHLGNVVLHVASTLLLFGVLRRMTGKLERSACVAALFALHPLHVESVAWASERKDVLSTLFWMLTLWAYLAYVRRPGLGRYATTIALFALGLMAKPMVVTLPFVLLLLDFWPLGRAGTSDRPLLDPAKVRGLVTEKIPFLALAVVSSAITVVVQHREGAVGDLETFPVGRRIVNALVSYGTYLVETFWPTRLAAIYPYPSSVAVGWALGSLVVLVAVTAMVLYGARRYRYLPVGWFWYLGTLVPVIGLVQVGIQSMTADRYSYVPLIGVFILLAWGLPDLLARWPHRRIALPVAAGLAVGVCALLTALQVPHWKDRHAVWSRAVAATTDNHLARNNLGNVLVETGRPREAVAHYVEALRIKPGYADAHNNLGLALFRLGQVDEAIAHYTEAIRLKPAHVDAHVNLALAFASQGRADDAIREWHEVVRLAPGEAKFHYALGTQLEKAGRSQDAARELEAAVRLDPGSGRARRALEELRSRRGGARLP
jgi:protein O-mannosyl-transferase